MTTTTSSGLITTSDRLKLLTDTELTACYDESCRSFSQPATVIGGSSMQPFRNEELPKVANLSDIRIEMKRRNDDQTRLTRGSEAVS